MFLIIFCFFIFFAPNFFGEPDNYIEANALVTPPHIVPEWYFLPYYAILRAVPNNFIGDWMGFVIIDAKLAGVIAMFGSILILLVLPWLDRSPVRSAKFRPLYKQFFWVLLLDCFVLGWVGANPPEGMFVVIGRIATLYYFAHFLVIIPVLGVMERPKPVPVSISEPVLKGGGAAAGANAAPMEKA